MQNETSDYNVKVSEAAKELGCSRQSVYAMIERGELEARNVGRRLTRISRSSLEKLKTGERPKASS